MKTNIFVVILFPLVLFLCDACKSSPTQSKDDSDTSSIIFGKSIEGIEIGDDSITVIRKLGQPTQILDGDFNGYILVYAEGILNYTNVFISNDLTLGLGVIVVSIDGPFQGRSKDSIGIGSERYFVISKIGTPDTTQGEPPVIDDIYNFKINSFSINYENERIHRISMSTPRLY
jgi:hypothetical protein